MTRKTLAFRESTGLPLVLLILSQEGIILVQSQDILLVALAHVLLLLTWVFSSLRISLLTSSHVSLLSEFPFSLSGSLFPLNLGSLIYTSRTERLEQYRV